MSTPDELTIVESPKAAPAEAGADSSSDGQQEQGLRLGIRVLRLRLKGVDRDYEVDFRDSEDEGPRSLSVVAGAFSTGKSSVLEFIAYCLGAASHPQHPEILRKVRSALLEVELSGQPHVIERAVGEPSTAAFVRPGRLGDIEIPPVEKRVIKPAGDPGSLSSLLLSYCGLEGVELREAPTQTESATDPLSIRDLLWLCFMPNERLDDKHLLFESSQMKALKLRQVVDVVFGVHDDKAVELGRRVKELETRLGRARTEYATTQAFLDEQELGTRIQVELARDEAERASTGADRALTDLDHQIRAASTFATDLRTRHRDAARRAQQAAALRRDRETQLRRFIPLRAQYADDITKLTMLAEARVLFDPLQVKVCPACLTTLREAPHIAGGHCTLCTSEITEHEAGQPNTGNTRHGSTPAISTGSDGAMTEAKFDVSSELRATKARLAEITQYVEELDAELGQLRASSEEADTEEAELARAVDAATNEAVSPFLSQRDDVMRSRQTAAANLERARTAIKMLDSLDRRAAAVGRLETSLKALRGELEHATTQPDRNEVVHRISERYARILTGWRYPKLEHAFVDNHLVPHMRGSSYTHASSGGRTLISLAWILSIFEIAWETGSAHPGFLMIDSPQKNLGQGGDRDAEFADSVAVADFYKHLHDWLGGPGQGAQVLVVDNAPPASVDDDIVVRFSRRADQPPYGLIEDEVS
jgi:DNA repair exonuclease SbcCD ATPase subunit